MEDIHIDDAFSAAWEWSPHGDLMIRVAMIMADRPGWAPKSKVVSVLCDIVEPTLIYAHIADGRLGYAIDTVRDWCAGDSEDDLYGLSIQRDLYDPAARIRDGTRLKGGEDTIAAVDCLVLTVDETGAHSAAFFAQAAAKHAATAEAIGAYEAASKHNKNAIKAYYTTYMLTKQWQADLVRRDLHIGDAR